MDLRARMGELLDLAAAGEYIVVERGRQPVAALVPYEDALRLRASPEEARIRALTALERLEALSRRLSDRPRTRRLS